MELKKQDSVFPVSTLIVTSRPLANYQPNYWGDRFLLESESDGACNEKTLKIEALKQDVRRELNEAAKSHMQQLKLIDAIQRLGVEYHFEMEIDHALQCIFQNYDHYGKNYNNDLYSTALCFRLLRQQGHNVSCDIFEKFKDSKGEFDESITGDVTGLLEFYEATYLSVQGEDILDDGRSFTSTHLQSVLPNLGSPISEQVLHALQNYSNRRGLPRVEARLYISIYQKMASHHESLLKLATLDFNMLQSLHKRELSEICRWWKGLDVPTKLPYVRDRIVETYFWTLGVYFEPQYSLARKILTRVQGFASIIDDTYDAYGLFEELKIFAEAIERWDIACLDQLPEYMKVIYKGLLELFEEIDDEMTRQGKSYRITYGKEAVKEIVRAYFDEAKLREAKYTPTMEEYMPLALRTSIYTPLTVISFLGVGDEATPEAFDWMFSQPDIVKGSMTVCRLVSDIVGHEFERERDHIPSAVEVYMNQHNVSEEETVNELNRRIEIAWKDINQGFLRPTKFPASLLFRPLNFARVIEVMYKKGDWYIHVGPEMKSLIKQVLVDPVPEE